MSQIRLDSTLAIASLEAGPDAILPDPSSTDPGAFQEYLSRANASSAPKRDADPERQEPGRDDRRRDDVPPSADASRPDPPAADTSADAGDEPPQEVDDSLTTDSTVDGQEPAVQPAIPADASGANAAPQPAAAVAEAATPETIPAPAPLPELDVGKQPLPDGLDKNAQIITQSALEESAAPVSADGAQAAAQAETIDANTGPSLLTQTDASSADTTEELSIGSHNLQETSRRPGGSGDGQTGPKEGSNAHADAPPADDQPPTPTGPSDAIDRPSSDQATAGLARRPSSAVHRDVEAFPTSADATVVESPPAWAAGDVRPAGGLEKVELKQSAEQGTSAVAAADRAAQAQPATAATRQPAGEASGARATVGGESRESETQGQVDRARFVQRVSRAFEAMGERSGTLRLRLSPPELGSLRLEIAVHQGVLSARIEAETPEARNLLLDNISGLRDRLAGQDIKVERLDVELMDRSGAGLSDQTANLPYDRPHPGQTSRPAENRPRQEARGATSEPRSTSVVGENRLNVVV